MAKLIQNALLKNLLKSLETLDQIDLIHHDIKPENFLVKSRKFKLDKKDQLTQIEISLTDFGMAGSGMKGGTPVYASPELMDKTDKKSDIFSFGRTLLFLLLGKQRFLKWLYSPIKDQDWIV